MMTRFLDSIPHMRHATDTRGLAFVAYSLWRYEQAGRMAILIGDKQEFADCVAVIGRIRRKATLPSLETAATSALRSLSASVAGRRCRVEGRSLDAQNPRPNAS